MEEKTLEILFAAIMGKRHPNYDRTIKVRETSFRMITGLNHAEWVTRYKPSENFDLKKQRVELYNPLTKYVLGRPRKYFKKFAQVQGVNVTVEGNTNRIDEINAVIERFTTRQNLISYLVETLEYKGVTDPNAWIFYDRQDVRAMDGSIVRTNVVPVVIGCVNALDFEISGGAVMYFCFRETRIEKDGPADKVFETYYCVTPGFVGKAVEESPKESAATNPGAIRTPLMVGNTKKYYYVSRVANGTNETPALPVGAYLDETTDQKSFVTWFDPAESVLQDLIRDKSLHDVNIVVTNFPRRYEYTKTCDHEHKDKGRCVGGWYNNRRYEDEYRCHACGGSGKLANHTSEQQVLQLGMPKTDKEFLELSKLSHTEEINTAWPTYLHERIERDVERVLEAVVNSGIVERATGAGTATEANYNYEDIYDLLKPFEDTVSRHWELVVRVAGQYMEIPLSKVDFRFPKDKKMKTMEQLVADLQAAKASGAGWDVVRQIQINIMEKQGEDNPEEIARAITRLDWLPFADKSPEQITMILAVRSATDFDRVLYENWLKVFTEIEAEQMAVPFHQMTYQRQKEIVTAKVNELRQQIILAGNEQEPQA